MTKKIAFINDTNNDTIFFAEFSFSGQKFDAKNAIINVIHVYSGDANKWIEWVMPENLEMYYLDWIEDIKTHRRKLIFKYLFETK